MNRNLGSVPPPKNCALVTFDRTVTLTAWFPSFSIVKFSRFSFAAEQTVVSTDVLTQEPLPPVGVQLPIARVVGPISDMELYPRTVRVVTPDSLAVANPVIALLVMVLSRLRLMKVPPREMVIAARSNKTRVLLEMSFMVSPV